MRLVWPWWRAVAYYREVPAARSRRELRRCLKEQITARERSDHFAGQILARLAATGLFLFCVWYGHPIIGLFAGVVAWACVYSCVDPLERARREYEARHTYDLHEINERVRKDRETGDFEEEVR